MFYKGFCDLGGSSQGTQNNEIHVRILINFDPFNSFNPFNPFNYNIIYFIASAVEEYLS